MTAFKLKRPEELLENTAFLLTDVGRLYRTNFDKRMKSLGLKRDQWWLISHLCYLDGSTQQELAEVMDISKGGVGKLIDRLEKDGMVTRESHSEDRRAKRVWLSATTRPLAGLVNKASDETIASSLSALSKAEAATLRRLLKKVRGALLQG